MQFPRGKISLGLIALLVCLVCLGFAIYDWRAQPSADVLSKFSFAAFPEFKSDSTAIATIVVENRTSQPMRIVGMSYC